MLLKNDKCATDLSVTHFMIFDMEELSFCESMVGDDDPFSYYAELEGIGLSEDNLFKDQ